MDGLVRGNEEGRGGKEGNQPGMNGDPAEEQEELPDEAAPHCELSMGDEGVGGKNGGVFVQAQSAGRQENKENRAKY